MDFVEFIFEDNVLNEIFENKFPLKITHYTVLFVSITDRILIANIRNRLRQISSMATACIRWLV